MDFLVPAHGISHTASVSGEGGRVEDDQVKERVSIRFFAMFLQPVEYIAMDPLTPWLQIIRSSALVRRLKGLLALVNCDHFRRSCFGTVQGKSAHEREGIQNTGCLHGGGEFSQTAIVFILVEINGGFVPLIQGDVPFQTVHFDPHRIPKSTSLFLIEHRLSGLQALHRSADGIIAFDDPRRRHDLHQGLGDHGKSLIHTQRRGLDDQLVSIAIDGKATQAIAFGMNQSKACSIR